MGAGASSKKKKKRTPSNSTQQQHSTNSAAHGNTANQSVVAAPSNLDNLSSDSKTIETSTELAVMTDLASKQESSQPLVTKNSENSSSLEKKPQASIPSNRRIAQHITDTCESPTEAKQGYTKELTPIVDTQSAAKVDEGVVAPRANAQSTGKQDDENVDKEHELDDWDASTDGAEEDEVSEEQSDTHIVESKSPEKPFPSHLKGKPYLVGESVSTNKPSSPVKLACVACGFVVLRFPDCRWSRKVDYFHFRNHAPDARMSLEAQQVMLRKLKRKLRPKPGVTAYSCMCSWQNIRYWKKLGKYGVSPLPEGGTGDSTGKLRWKLLTV